MPTSLILTGVKFPDDSVQTTAGNIIGINQTWQDLTGSRSLTTTYTNNTAKSIMVSVICGPTAASGDIQLRINEILIQRYYTNPDSSSLILTVWGIVPPGSTYRVNTTNLTLISWTELR